MVINDLGDSKDPYAPYSYDYKAQVLINTKSTKKLFNEVKKVNFGSFMDKQSDLNIVWMDLEMTGLDPDSEIIIEIADAVTNHDLTEIIEWPNLVIKQPQEFINNMDEWNTKQHGRSVLFEKVKSSLITETQAEKETIKFL